MPIRIALLLGLCAVLGCTFINPTDFECADDSNCPSGYVCGQLGGCVVAVPDDGDGGTTSEPDAGAMDAGSSPVRDAGPQLMAPSDLTYLVNPAAYPVGQPIAPNTPSSGGGAVVSYAVSPALPAGLTLSATTGVITGMPTKVSAVASFTVTAQNTAGSTMATLMISVTVATCDPTTNVSCPDGQICNLMGTCLAPKYTAAGGAVTDGNTTLVWQQAVGATCFSGGAGTCTLAAATTYCSGLNLNGTGWMVPTLTQLYSLVLMGPASAPQIDATEFPSVTGVPFWTSTTGSTSSYAYTVDFSTGYSVSGVPVTDAAAVLCVK